jgi:hypothetical protein
MGSAEFEFGSLGRSATRFRAAGDLVLVQTPHARESRPKAKLWMLTSNRTTEDNLIRVKSVVGGRRLKERNTLHQILYPSQYRVEMEMTKTTEKDLNTRYQWWWDIENDWFVSFDDFNLRKVLDELKHPVPTGETA